MTWFFVVLTFLQLVLHHHQEGHRYHEEVEAEADLTELPHGSSTHLAHHILIGVLSADGRCIAEDHQATDEENQAYLPRHQERRLDLNCTQVVRQLASSCCTS